MANLAAAIKAEVTRLARKELRTETKHLKNTIAARSDIAALKRRTSDLEKAMKALTRATENGKRSSRPAQEAAVVGQLWFCAQGMARNRKRLGLSANDFGPLMGTSGQSVYSWESGKSKPRAQNLAAIAALRSIGKREVAVRLEALTQTA